MLARTVLFSTFLLAAGPASSLPYCPGGDVHEHVARAQIRTAPLYGTYSSACTMFLARSCVFPDTRRGPKTILKFHSAMPVVVTSHGTRYMPGERPGMHQWGNQEMMRHYPQPLRDYILRNGCFETTQFKPACILTGSQLIRLGARRC